MFKNLHGTPLSKIRGSTSPGGCNQLHRFITVSHSGIRDSFGQDSFNGSHFRRSKSRFFYCYAAFGWLRVHRQQEHAIEPFVYIAGSFIGKRFVYLRAAGTNHILTQWLLFWWLITAQWPVLDYMWCQESYVLKNTELDQCSRDDSWHYNFVSRKCSNDGQRTSLACSPLVHELKAAISTTIPGFLTL